MSLEKYTSAQTTPWFVPWVLWGYLVVLTKRTCAESCWFCWHLAIRNILDFSHQSQIRYQCDLPLSNHQRDV